MTTMRQVKVVMLLALVSTITVIAVIEAEAYMLPDTGQILCYEYDSGTVVSCGTSGEDGQYTINPMSFTNNNDGTVTDNNTGLMWQKCSAGQNNDTNCSGTASSYNWYQATGTYHDSYNPSSQTICGALNSSNFAGYQDWRLPSALELQTIVDYSIASLSPSIMAASFPNTQVDYYWSTSTDPYHLSYAWHVHFGSGIVNRDSRSSSTNYVRCVRGAQTVQSFTDNGNDTVTDNKTGLIWEKGEAGPYTWGSALSYCADMGQPWRLPNIKELASLIDFSMPNLIDTNYFPNTLSNFDFWSSTTDVLHPYDTWGVHFVNDGAYYGSGGVSLGYSKVSNTRYVRCVHGGINVCPDHAVTISGTTNYYSTIQSAYLAAHVADSILVQAMFLTENLSFDRSNIPVALKGGYSCNTYDHSFGTKSGYTTLIGKLTISGGTVTVENLIIK